ncbi:MAG: pirin family protein [Alphaproteobacteria bacterium]|nr:pirin family protein [Alphaproteobacteria bacterium]
MMNIIPYNNLGKANYGWLNAHYHFSFSRYYNPDRMGFGPLRVVNDDIVAAGKGFDPHGHDNMEIITYVRKGAISHKDSHGNVGRTEAGDVQVMSAGSGVVHSEYNLEDEDTQLYQIWIMPDKLDVSPAWAQMKFPKEPVDDHLTLVVSGNPDDQALHIHQDAAIYAGRLEAGTVLRHVSEKPSYILASDGKMTINGNLITKGDAAEVDEPEALVIEALEPSEVLIIEVPYNDR